MYFIRSKIEKLRVILDAWKKVSSCVDKGNLNIKLKQKAI